MRNHFWDRDNLHDHDHHGDHREQKLEKHHDYRKLDDDDEDEMETEKFFENDPLVATEEASGKLCRGDDTTSYIPISSSS